MSHFVAPSLLAANFAHLSDEIAMINSSSADWLHLDIMDGVFVPNISYGFSVLEAVAPICQKRLDMHLMIVNPEKFISQIADLGTYMMTVHYEACTHLHRTIYEIRRAGMKVGVALNPATPVSMLTDIIRDIDMVLIMSVNPGFGGQTFISHSLDKIQEALALITATGSHALIEVDGGVTMANASALISAGANVLVAGSTVFRAESPLQVIETLKSL